MGRGLNLAASIFGAALVLALGCEVTRPLGWSYQDDGGGLGVDEVRVATLWDGPCDTGDILWSAVLPEDATATTFDPPLLSGEGPFCFEILVVDRADDCAVLRGSQERRELRGDEQPMITNRLGPLPASVTCVPRPRFGDPFPNEEVSCDPMVGCVRCPERWVRCVGDDVPVDVRGRYCCDFEFHCDEAGLPSRAGDCVEIAPR